MVLNFRIAKSPLSGQENEQILEEYNRLTSSQIPLNEFVHWVQNGPAGTAWHAILETDEGRIVGHTSVFPLRTAFGDSSLVPAKSEYSFMHEDFRSAKIRGLENVSKPVFIIILDQLFQHCIAQGWGPIFASTGEKNQVFTRRVGLRPLEFALSECLLILRPLSGSRHTPNLTRNQRIALFGVGLLQYGPWTIASALPRLNGVHTAPLTPAPMHQERERLSFFEDPDSLGWRYLGNQYVQFSFHGAPEDYVIAKKGDKERYLRVCQWHLGATSSLFPLIQALVEEARRQKAMSVRWAVYESGEVSKKIVRQLQTAGFFCRPRTRIVMVHKQKSEFLDTSKWNMNDSLFSFDP